MFKAKLKQKNGGVSIEAAVVMAILLPIILGLLIGGYLFFLTESQNVSINFDTGRYVSTNGCNVNTIESLTSLDKWDGYKVTVLYENKTDGTEMEEILTEDSAKGEIIINCTKEKEGSSEFNIITKKKVIDGYGGGLFPNEVSVIRYYVEENN